MSAGATMVLAIIAEVLEPDQPMTDAERCALLREYLDAWTPGWSYSQPRKRLRRNAPR